MPAHWVLTNERYEAGPALRPAPTARELGPGGVDVLPELDGDDVAHGPRVLPVRRRRRRWTSDSGSVAKRSVACHSVSVPESGRPMTARSRRAACDPRRRSARGPGTPRRRGSAPCPRPVRRSARPRRWTRPPGSGAHGSLASSPPVAVAVAAAVAPLLLLLLLLLLDAELAVGAGPASMGGPAGAGRPGAAGARAWRVRRPTTQVSLDPPPWLELTTRPPSPSATRVRPPGRTQMSSPSLTAKGRRSTWRRTMAWSTQVGEVERATTRWAIQCRGSASTSSASSSSSAPVAAGPMTRPLPPEPSTRLNTSSSRRARASCARRCPPGAWSRRSAGSVLAQVVADHGRHVGVDELVVGHAVAHAVGDGHPPGPGGVDHARAADEGLGTELQRVEVVVVDAPVDHVHRDLALGRAQEDVGAVADQVTALDQVHAHEAGQQRVLVEGGVVHARREHHDGRVLHRRRGGPPQRVDQAGRVVGHHLDRLAPEQLG